MDKKKWIAVFFLLSLYTAVFSQNQYKSQIQLLRQKIATTSNTLVKAQYLLNLGNIYQQLDSTDQAIAAYSKAYQYIFHTRNYQALYQLSTYLGFLYAIKGDYNQSIKYFRQSVKFAKTLGNRKDLAHALVNLANSERNAKQYKAALKDYESALSMAFDMDNLQLLKNIYANMAICYQGLNDKEHYMKYFNLSVAIDRKIKEQIIKQKEEEARKQAELARKRQLLLQLQTYHTKAVEDSLRYAQQLNEKNKIRIMLLEKEAQLKELQVRQREAELKRQQALLRAKQTVIISLVILLIIILIAAVIVYRLYKDKQRAYEELERLNEELKRVNAELEEKNRKIEQQKKELEKKNRQIRDSINYASRIQRAILPSQAAISAYFPHGSFIFYLPRDVVSGDFYWFSDRGQYKFLALVDCTGHSVPGAFMSLIGNTLLNEIVNSQNEYNPAQILLKLHENVVKLLHQQSSDTVQDGMDIALCRFEPEKNELVFASANQPLFVVYPDGTLVRLDGDIYSIGGYMSRLESIEFKNFTLELKEDTNLYLSSDGYFDQFNKQMRRKFSKKRFVNLIKEIYDKPMGEQFKIIQQTFYEWKGDYYQVDDVLVIGVRYSSVMKDIDFDRSKYE